MVTMPHDRPPRKRGSILGRAGGLSFQQNVITCPRVSATSYLVNSRGLFPMDKRVGA